MNKFEASEWGMGGINWVLMGIAGVLISLYAATCYFIVAAPPTPIKKIQVQVDCLVSPDMVKYLEHEGHGKIVSEEDME